eukprot:CAMPEP_0198118970 /NCGR_PEP_ID=MMETSP1442-20131203/23828_1 /TAXON_ID= /ORGANISM="Craspedostauros australis, Strain CCMP3328" /LENGTH=163 /DNA_ID=CAMNT_0043777341 /DNA_START=325 /DNA_END=813 /DNA_ORIENTATION=-
MSGHEAFVPCSHVELDGIQSAWIHSVLNVSQEARQIVPVRKQHKDNLVCRGDDKSSGLCGLGRIKQIVGVQVLASVGVVFAVDLLMRADVVVMVAVPRWGPRRVHIMLCSQLSSAAGNGAGLMRTGNISISMKVSMNVGMNVGVARVPAQALEDRGQCIAAFM